MNDEEIRAALTGLQPPEDLFWQMARQGDWEKREPVMVFKKISREEARCSDLPDRRITTCDPPAVLWCSKCEQSCIVGWEKKKVLQPSCGRGMMQSPRSGVLMVGGGSDCGMDDVLWEGDHGLCPLCRAHARLRHTSWLGKSGLAQQLIATVPYRVQDTLILVRWWMEERLETVYLGCRTRRWTSAEKAWVIDGKTVQQWRKMAKWYGFAYEELPEWEKQRRAEDRIGIPYFYTKDPPCLDGTGLENCKLWDWMRATYKETLFAPLAYLRLYQRHCNVEVLVTAGCGRLLGLWMKDECQVNGYYYSSTTWWRSPKLAWISWKERRPSAMLGLNRQQLKDCLGAKVKDEVRDLYIRRGAAAGLSMEECKTLVKVANVPEELLKCGKDPHKILRYLEKENETWYTLQDYWSMQKRLGVDVQADPALEWPRRLRAAHDRVQSAVRYKADAKKEAEFAAMTARLQGLVWEHDGICIRPAASIRELVEEGTVLHHCVGGYGPAHCAGRCIFFIRHTRRPERSWFTLNVDVNAKKILQNHGYGNEWAHGKRLHIPRAVEEFVDLWEKEVLRSWTLPPEKGTEQKAKTKKPRAQEAPAA